MHHALCSILYACPVECAAYSSGALRPMPNALCDVLYACPVKYEALFYKGPQIFFLFPFKFQP